MNITNYQMHNVLKVYTNHLSKDRTHTNGQPKIRKPNSDMVRISAEGKRQNLIERVAADIVARITKEGIDTSTSSEADIATNKEKLAKQPSPQKKNAQFEYNVMQGSEKKSINRLSVENAGFLLRRIEELTGGSEPMKTDLPSSGSEKGQLDPAIEYDI
jgi:hypothetical protein